MKRGDEGSAIFTVRSGLVKLVQYLSDGTQRIVRLLRQGDTLGLEVLLDRNYEHTAITLQGAACCRIPRTIVQRLSEETPRLHRQLMLRWHQSVARADEWITKMSTGRRRGRGSRGFCCASCTMNRGATVICSAGKTWAPCWA